MVICPVYWARKRPSCVRMESFSEVELYRRNLTLKIQSSSATSAALNTASALVPKSSRAAPVALDLSVVCPVTASTTVAGAVAFMRNSGVGTALGEGIGGREGAGETEGAGAGSSVGGSVVGSGEGYEVPSFMQMQ